VSVFYPIEDEFDVYRKFWLNYRIKDKSITWFKAGKVWLGSEKYCWGNLDANWPWNYFSWRNLTI